MWHYDAKVSLLRLSCRFTKEQLEKAHPIPGLYTKLPSMSAFNDTRSALDRRTLLFYTTVGDMPPINEAPTLHAAAHIYASDRNSLEMIAHHCGFDKTRGAMSSLSFMIIFHTTPSGYAFQESAARPGQDGAEQWYIQEVSGDRLADGRGNHRSRIFDRNGQHVATTLQDGLIRIKFRDEAEAKRVLDGLRSSKETAKL